MPRNNVCQIVYLRVVSTQYYRKRNEQIFGVCITITSYANNNFSSTFRPVRVPFLRMFLLYIYPPVAAECRRHVLNYCNKNNSFESNNFSPLEKCYKRTKGAPRIFFVKALFKKFSFVQKTVQTKIDLPLLNKFFILHTVRGMGRVV